jgi:hypothetical protein
MRRARREWSQEGDMQHKDADCKKLWTNYYCGKLKIRRYSSSEKKRRTETAAKPPDLVKNMNNSTDEKKPKLIKQWLITWDIKFNPAFEPYNGKVNPESREYMLAMKEKEERK